MGVLCGVGGTGEVSCDGIGDTCGVDLGVGVGVGIAILNLF